MSDSVVPGARHIYPETRGGLPAVRPGGDQYVPQPSLSAQDAQRAQAFAVALARVLQNTQMTASQPAYAAPGFWDDPVDRTARVTVPAAVGNYVTALQVQAPPGRWMVIEGYGVNVVNPTNYTYDGSILWRIRQRRRTGPVGNVTDLYDWGEQRGSIVQPRKTIIVLPPDSVVYFDVRRAVLGTEAQVDHCLVGRLWVAQGDYDGPLSGVV